MIILKSPREIQAMREAGRIVAETLEVIRRAVAPGVTTAELDRLARDYILRRGGIPSFKGFQGYPANICTSVNEEVVHGIPGLRVLQKGDIISVDVGVITNNYQGDAAMTFPVGEITPEVQRLLEVTREALFRGIAQARVGRRLGDISHAIQTYVEGEGFSVVREFVGHGIGREMHEDPQVPNFGRPGRGPRLAAGMTLAIEPMVNMGGAEVKVLGNGWTVVTRDGRWSAHFEHTVVITEGEPQLLTLL